MKQNTLSSYTHLVKALAQHFGASTEVVLHDLETKDPKHSIIAIENSHVTGRKIGDGPSHVVIDALKNDQVGLENRYSYLTKTEDGKILKSTTIYLRDDSGKIIGILGLNTDISLTLALEETLHNFHMTESPDAEPEPITTNVAELLDTLILKSIQLIGKPTSLMSKDEKIKAIRFLNDSGAFLITKSGPKVCSAFGISKYTLYSYLDEAKAGN